MALLGYALAFYFLAQSLKYIPLGVAYAIWSGLDTMGLVLLGLVIRKEILGPVHIFGIALIMGAWCCATSPPAPEGGAPKKLIYLRSA